MSSPPLFTMGDDYYHDYLFIFLTSILPNLRDVNLSNNGFPSASLDEFSRKCPNLENITWHRRHGFLRSRYWSVMKYAANVKEIHMDNSTFFGGRAGRLALFSDLEDDDDGVFLFSLCSNKLKRVSIRNATFYDYESHGEKTVVVPQTALIKFVRNVPSLKWFRSKSIQREYGHVTVGTTRYWIFKLIIIIDDYFT